MSDAGDWTWFASVLAFATAMAATPGPNNTMVVASGATWGFRRSLPHMAGVAIGFPVLILAVAFGVGDLLAARPWVPQALRWICAGYLLWLAWKIARARPVPAVNDARLAPRGDTARPGRAARPLGFGQAALFQWVNPKAWVISISGVVTYTSAGSGRALQAVLLAAIFFGTTFLSVALWTLVGVGAARLLRSPAALRRFNLAMAALLVASLLPLLFE